VTWQAPLTWATDSLGKYLPRRMDLRKIFDGAASNAHLRIALEWSGRVLDPLAARMELLSDIASDEIDFVLTTRET